MFSKIIVLSNLRSWRSRDGHFPRISRTIRTAVCRRAAWPEPRRRRFVRPWRQSSGRPAAARALPAGRSDGAVRWAAVRLRTRAPTVAPSAAGLGRVSPVFFARSSPPAEEFRRSRHAERFSGPGRRRYRFDRGPDIIGHRRLVLYYFFFLFFRLSRNTGILNINGTRREWSPDIGRPNSNNITSNTKKKKKK